MLDDPSFDGTVSGQNELPIMIENLDDRLVKLTASGELDMLTAPRFTEAVLSAVGAGPRGVIVDLRRVTFLASAGLTALIVAHREAAASAVRFTIIADSPTTLRPLTLTDVAGVIGVHPDLAQAVKALAR
ncbi:STAS domain-containing protein [Antrihabitans sp. YC2-6]|uniref:STAS domain-containing protein n=1 Tax=Antrihabitans sp. YC2-6 TaxID=2799498 RepID=UPI0018F75A4E|nr:STAS domain-containing protein [Antrihabitans sp. YC2-6]MBJ8345703.1 STAS domain-containing protein [Antrihabitans sp. YC2-6]